MEGIYAAGARVGEGGLATGFTNMNMGDVPVPSFTREQKQQIKQYTDKVLVVLGWAQS